MTPVCSCIASRDSRTERICFSTRPLTDLISAARAAFRSSQLATCASNRLLCASSLSRMASRSPSLSVCHSESECAERLLTDAESGEDASATPAMRAALRAVRFPREVTSAAAGARGASLLQSVRVSLPLSDRGAADSGAADTGATHARAIALIAPAPALAPALAHPVAAAAATTTAAAHFLGEFAVRMVLGASTATTVAAEAGLTEVNCEHTRQLCVGRVGDCRG
mmetsp:Transcript_25931/g.60749  ORF Transcript_25931/g.60749 Transcript_25931/m.60749 type:complete len:226 (-) Transcript_25931:111-788(-)